MHKNVAPFFQTEYPAAMKPVKYLCMLLMSVIRSTPPSGPNNIRVVLKCPSVRPFTKSFSDFNEIRYVDRGR